MKAPIGGTFTICLCGHVSRPLRYDATQKQIKRAISELRKKESEARYVTRLCAKLNP